MKNLSGNLPRELLDLPDAGGWVRRHDEIALTVGPNVACRNTVQELPIRLTSYIPIPKTL